MTTSETSEQLDIFDELDDWDTWFRSLSTSHGWTDEHECFYRGCKEVVTGRYHCDRHEAILQWQRDTQARRNSENTARRRMRETGAA